MFHVNVLQKYTAGSVAETLHLSVFISLFNGAFMQQLLLSYLSTRERQMEGLGFTFRLEMAITG